MSLAHTTVYEQQCEEFLLDHNIATQSEIDLVTDINGYNETTFNDIIYAKTGYRDLSQLESEYH